MAANKLPPSQLIYDLTELRKVDPALVRFEEKEAVALPPAAVANGIAIGPQDALWVADEGGVRSFDAAGMAAGEFAVPGQPQRVAVARDGTVYVTLPNHVEVYDTAGTRLAAWAPADPKSFLTCIAVAANDVFVADSRAPAVLRYDLGGKLLGRIGEENEAKNIPGIIVPSPYFDVAVGPDGALWAANPGRHRVECYTPGGDLKSWWGRSSPKIDSFCGCCNPTHIALAPDGSFVTSEKGLPRVKVYAKTGEFESVVAPPSAFAETAVGLDVAVDSRGRVYVLDAAAKKVRVFERKKAEAKP